MQTSSMLPKSPDAYQKRSSMSRDEDIAKRMFHVDTLHVNKEKKLFFQTVNNDYNYFPFGAPGGGAPLRNQNNEPVSRLPNINDNLWKRFPSQQSDKQQPPPPPKEVDLVDQKKKQVLELIDAYANNKNVVSPPPNLIDPQNSFCYGPNKRTRHPEHRYDPVTRDHIRPETYWNDWFGRPGAGAPNWNAHKKNLGEMLEPRGGRGAEAIVSSSQPYQPSLSKSNSSLFPNSGLNRYRSNHYNNYEVPPPQQQQQDNL